MGPVIDGAIFLKTHNVQVGKHPLKNNREFDFDFTRRSMGPVIDH